MVDPWSGSCPTRDGPRQRAGLCPCREHCRTRSAPVGRVGRRVDGVLISAHWHAQPILEALTVACERRKCARPSGCSSGGFLASIDVSTSSSSSWPDAGLRLPVLELELLDAGKHKYAMFEFV